MRTDVEPGFVLAKDLEPEATSLHNALDGISYVEPALEVLDSRIETEGRTIPSPAGNPGPNSRFQSEKG